VGYFDSVYFTDYFDIGSEEPAPPNHGHGGRGFLPEKPRAVRKDNDDDLMVVTLL
jgi:hypothetical protein